MNTGQKPPEVVMADLLSRDQTRQLTPPVAAPALLPFGELAPPVFERLAVVC